MAAKKKPATKRNTKAKAKTKTAAEVYWQGEKNTCAEKGISVIDGGKNKPYPYIFYNFVCIGSFCFSSYICIRLCFLAFYAPGHKRTFRMVGIFTGACNFIYRCDLCFG